MHWTLVIGHSSFAAVAPGAPLALVNDASEALAFAAVAVAVAYLAARVWRKRRAARSGGCASSGEGCGCSAVKKNLRA